jgi:8-amino-7-oxononanoate synthase
VNGLDQDLAERLRVLRDNGLLRELRRIDSAQGRLIHFDGRDLLNFSSNDYLGLAAHPALVEAAEKAMRDFGVGSGASRLVCGSLKPHHELEEALAAYKGAEAALTFSSGYATAVGTICALLEKDDVVIIDKLVHACCVDAARQSGARLRVFGHNDLGDLEDTLQWALDHHASSRILIVTESVFSMDGDTAPLRELVELKDRFGAWLMLDEAHATGVLGRNGRGLAAELGVADRVEVQMGTFGKAFGSAGGYICGSRTLVDFLVNKGRSFIFSTAPTIPQVAAAKAGIDLCASADGDTLRERLQQNIADVKIEKAPTGLAEGNQQPAILPVVIGDEARTLEAAAQLREEGLFIPAIRFPTVARGKARLRVTLTASHTAADVAQLNESLAGISATP